MYYAKMTAKCLQSEQFKYFTLLKCGCKYKMRFFAIQIKSNKKVNI